MYDWIMYVFGWPFSCFVFLRSLLMSENVDSFMPLPWLEFYPGFTIHTFSG